MMGSITENNPLLRKIKEAVSDLQPEAEVILYGSRARGTSTAGSDWDLLLLVPRDSRPMREIIRRRIYEIEWSCGEVFSVVIRQKDAWNNPRVAKSPFHRNVENEGIRL